MVLWANLHGGFVLGIVLQIIFILGTSIDERASQLSPFRDIIKNNTRSLTILFLSLFAVCLNPFGYELLLFPFQVSKGIFSE